MEETRSRLWEESLPRVVDTAIEARLEPMLNNTSRCIERLEAEMVRVRSDMKAEKKSAEEATSETRMSMQKLAALQDDIPQQVQGSIDQLCDDFKRHQELASRQYDSCRQAIHVIAAAINERGEAGCTAD